MTDPADWARLEPLFDQALDLQPTEREAFVSRVMRDDPELGAELRSLLTASNRDEGPLDESLAKLMGSAFAEDVEHVVTAGGFVGRIVGHYRIEELVGRGGMGTVFRAQRADGEFEQTVAIKILRWDIPGVTAVPRFRTERQLLAVLDHPNIARLIDGGMTEDGLPYLVMEFVDGVPIDRYCQEAGLVRDDRLRLFRQVCEVVHFAHRNLVVHRDLKPSNILITADGTVKLLDFGIAKLLGEPDDLTVAGQQPHTPRFGAPEQRAGGPITTATDAYALGLLLSVLLAGRHAAGEERMRPTPQSGFSRDLRAIVEKALRESPEERYASAAELSEDVRRCLESEPVGARRGSTRYRLGRFIRRNRVAVLATAAVMAALVSGTVVALGQARRAVEEADNARAAAERARRVSGMLTDLFDVTDPFTTAPGGSVDAKLILDRGLQQAEATLGSDPATQAEMLTVLGDAYGRLGFRDEGLALLERAASLRQELGDNLGLAETLHRAGQIEEARHNPDEADSWYRQALELRRAAGEDATTEVGFLLAGRARAHIGLGRAEEAMAYSDSALALLQGRVAEDDAGLLNQLTNRARILALQGDLEGAAAQYEQVLERQTSALGPLHEARASTLNNLAMVRSRQGAHQAAVDAYRGALEVIEATAGPAHPTAVLIRTNLASTLNRMDRIEESEALLLDNLSLVREHAPEDLRRLERALSVLSGAYLVWGRFGDAAAVLNEGLGVLDRLTTATPTEPDIQRLKLAYALTGAGRTTEAAALRREAHGSLRAGGSLNRPALQQLEWVAGLYDTLGFSDLAGELRALALGLTPPGTS